MEHDGQVFNALGGETGTVSRSFCTPGPFGLAAHRRLLVGLRVMRELLALERYRISHRTGVC